MKFLTVYIPQLTLKTFIGPLMNQSNCSISRYGPLAKIVMHNNICYST